MGRSVPQSKQIGKRCRAVTRWAVMQQRVNSIDPKNACYKDVKITIDREEFIQWFMANDFEGCTVDRIDPSKDYESGNLQLVTKKVNFSKDKIKAKDGKCECRLCKVTKPLEEFVKSRQSHNGWSTTCKECERARNLNRNRERHKRAAEARRVAS